MKKVIVFLLVFSCLFIGCKKTKSGGNKLIGTTWINNNSRIITFDDEGGYCDFSTISRDRIVKVGNYNVSDNHIRINAIFYFNDIVANNLIFEGEINGTSMKLNWDSSRYFGSQNQADYISSFQGNYIRQ